MQDEHKKAIQNNFTSLVERTDLDSMVIALFEKGVFSEAMIEPYVYPAETERERKRKLYRDITRRGPHAFENLIDALRELGYWDLVRDLDPQTPLQLRSQNSSSSNPRGDEGFLSISTEKKKNKPNLGMQNNSPLTPPPETEINDDTADPVDTDSTTDILEFHVIKSTKFMEDDDSNDIKLYHTRGRQRGVLLVFSYTDFKMNMETYRQGIEVDCKNLKYLFSEFGFNVLSYHNLTLQETHNTLDTLEKVLKGVESVFIVFSSHGYERKGTQDTDIRCSDGYLISFSNILDYFNNRRLPHLADIPKVFIFQVCRGSTSDYVYGRGEALSMSQSVSRDGRPTAASAESLARRQPPADPVPVQQPLFTNILIAHSTLPGFVSYRDNKTGSWFIQTVCEVFAEHAHDCHVDRLFTLVDMRMRSKYRIQTSSVDRWGFNKKLYLHPGLFE